MISERISDDIPPQMKNLNTVIEGQASVNVMKQTCVIVILAHLTLLQPNSH